MESYWSETRADFDKTVLNTNKNTNFISYLLPLVQEYVHSDKTRETI